MNSFFAVTCTLFAIVGFGCAKVRTGPVTKPQAVMAKCKPEASRIPKPRLIQGGYQPVSFTQAILSTTDFQTGKLVGIDLDRPGIRVGVPIHSDAVSRGSWNAETVFVVNRLGADNIQIVSKDLQRSLKQFSVGRGTNPQDVVSYRDSIYVSRLRSKTLLKLNAKTGENLKEIDFSDASDGDGFPEMTMMRLEKDRLLVLIQRLDTGDGYLPAGPGKIAVVDVNQDKVEKYLDLECGNPVGKFREDNTGALYVAEAGKVGDNDGGIERLDGVSLESEGMVVWEKELGGDLIDFEIIDSTHGVAVISDPNTRLVLFNPSTGKRVETLVRSSGYFLQGVALDRVRNRLYVTDRFPAKPSVRVFDATTLREQNGLNWNLELPPYQMELIP